MRKKGKPETFEVIQTVNERYLRRAGEQISLRKIWKPWAGIVVIGVILLFIGQKPTVEGLDSLNIYAWIGLGLLFGTMIAVAIIVDRAGKSFYKEYRTKDQPIHLPKLPSWWRNK